MTTTATVSTALLPPLAPRTLAEHVAWMLDDVLPAEMSTIEKARRVVYSLNLDPEMPAFDNVNYRAGVDAMATAPADVAIALRMKEMIESAEVYVYESESGDKHDRVVLAIGSGRCDAGCMQHAFDYLRRAGRPE